MLNVYGKIYSHFVIDSDHNNRTPLPQAVCPFRKQYTHSSTFGGRGERFLRVDYNFCCSASPAYCVGDGNVMRAAF